MQGIIFLLFIIEIAIQISSLVNLKTTKNQKYWNTFIGITIANFIFNYIAYLKLADDALGLGDAILIIFTCGFSFVSNVILLIVGIIIKRTIKNAKIRLNRNSFFIGTLIMAINLIILFALPVLTFKIIVARGERNVINYLNKEYGKNNYETVNVCKDYSDNGMWDRYLSGYYYEIKSDYMKNTFMVKTDKYSNHIEADYFLPVYYSQKYNLDYILECKDGYHWIRFDDKLDDYMENHR